MRGKSEVIVAGTVAAATMMATGLLGLAPAQAAPAATVSVPCSVRALVLAVTSVSSGEELSLARGCTYLLTQGLPVVSEDLTIEGNGATLERSDAPGTPAFVILASDAALLTVSRLSFRNGDGGIAMDSGGELFVNGGTFTGNTAADGGAISDPSGGYNGPVVSNATFIDNRATDSGGAIGAAAAEEGVYVTNCIFSGNEAANFGGAISDFSAGEYVYGSVFLGNSALNGGALFLDPNGGADVSHDAFNYNSATENGGGIYSQYGLGIDNSKFSGNHSGGRGGGLYIDVVAYEDTVAAVDFTGNSATDGGAIGNLGETGLELTDVAISGNYATAYGGGIYNTSEFAAVSTQITRNSAVSGGGGVYNVEDEDYFTPTLTNSSVVDNKPDNCEPLGSIPGCSG
jgi:predicted outer membrane repeat protein